LAQIRAWTDDGIHDNTALRVYGGDLLGNVWRFDVNGDIGAPGFDAQLLATLKDESGNAQPITTKPELGNVSGVAVVYLGTGRYLGASDLNDRSQQSLYAIKDNLSAVGYGNPRVAPSSAGFVHQNLSTTNCPPGSAESICTAGQQVRTGSNLAVDFATQNGWYVDFPDSGERATNDPQLALGTLALTTNIPSTNVCLAGGASEFYFFDYRTGRPVSTSSNNVVGKRLGNALSTRSVFARLPGGKIIALMRLSDGTTIVANPPISSIAGTTRRLSWRELLIGN
jgi:type IV pilus assembly protein PilY1